MQFLVRITYKDDKVRDLTVTEEYLPQLKKCFKRGYEFFIHNEQDNFMFYFNGDEVREVIVQKIIPQEKKEEEEKKEKSSEN